ncbi:hypothetical protein [Adlercreutzia caecimuris]|uniref:hypothetical protein n=1 Tax=Adlercreutzia caecimuris TaxID=671266 RepID=UPI00272A6536|nr:hypothetical protein [Adlercreutzia caecimuris]
MAKTLKFDTGVEEYDLNGCFKARFNPTDTSFVERLYKVFDDLEKAQGAFQARVDEIGDDGPALFAYAAERDAEMRGHIDSLLGEGAADALFPDINCYAMADGLPIWVNLMFALAEEVEDAFAREQGKGDPRVRKYNAKYEAMRKKYKRVK